MNRQTLFNPFSKIDEKYLLFLGIIFFGINAIVCYYSGTVNDAVFHYSKNENSSMINVLKINFLSNIIMTSVMFIMGKMMNRRTRLIDIINTVLISQIPLILILPISQISFIKNTLRAVSKIDPSKTQNLPVMDLIFLSVYGFIMILFLVYSIVLLYNGFKTATNIKKWQYLILFFFIVFLTILTSQIIL